VRGVALTMDLNPSPDLLRKSTSPKGRGEISTAATDRFQHLVQL
jgi:hypothetical protein